MDAFRMIGRNITRVDGLEKATGRALYSVDLKLPGMLYAKVLRSPYPHARIININTSRAEGYPGVKAVITGKDAPDEKVGHIRDRNIIARDRVRFSGEPVAAIAAETVEAAEEAIERIEVEYEGLPSIFDAEESMEKNPSVIIHPDLFKYSLTPQPYPLYKFEADRPNVYVHRQIRKGDLEMGFEHSDIILENRFSTPMAQHCSLEPHNAIAKIEPDGGLTVWDSTHLLYIHKMELSRLFKLPPEKVRVISLYIGGCFGGKAGLIVPGIASLLAIKTGRPVKLVLDREEIFVDGTSREEMIIYIKDGIKSDGTLLAREMKLILNAGGYSGTTVLVAKNAAFGAVGTYRIPNFKLDSYAVATNRPPTGAFRGFGSTEVIWAIESQMDMIAERLRMDPLEIRMKNLLKEGEEDVCGMITHSIGAKECLDKVARWIEWDKICPLEKGPWRRGKGIAVGNKYTMPGTRTAVDVKLNRDGTIEVRYSTHEVGQGCNTILSQITAEEFKTSIENVKLVQTDTALTPFDSGTISSRSTFHAGNALKAACDDLKRKLFDIISERFNIPSQSLELIDGIVYDIKGEEIIKIEELFKTTGYLLKGGELIGHGLFAGPLEPEDAETGQGIRPVTSYAHGANAVEVMVNIETGEVKVLRAGACFDMGQPINPELCKGQMEGGMGMGIGTALFEEMIIEGGKVSNPNFREYKIPSSLDIPSYREVESMMAFAPHSEGPYGAKGFSEGGLVSVAPAIGNAIYRATGVRIKDLPITRDKILRGLKELNNKDIPKKTVS